MSTELLSYKEQSVGAFCCFLDVVSSEVWRTGKCSCGLFQKRIFMSLMSMQVTRAIEAGTSRCVTRLLLYWVFCWNFEAQRGFFFDSLQVFDTTTVTFR